MITRYNVVSGGIDADSEAGIRAAVAALEAGALVIIPTDTVYGVAAHPGVQGALGRLYEAKHRDHGKPIAFLASDPDAVGAFGAEVCPEERRLMDTFWPGPLTLILRLGQREEGFRIPDCDVARDIIRRCGGVLHVTSANSSGEPPALCADAAAAALGAHVAVVLDAGPSPGGVPSSVVKVENGSLRLLREGAVSLDRLQAAARSAT